MTPNELPKDPLLPQLQTMWDADLMTEVFRKGLRPLGKKNFQIEACQILRFRYRPSVRSIVLYELLLHEMTTGEKQTLWVTGTTYPGDRAKKRYKKVQAILPERITQAACFSFEPSSFIPDLKMIAQIFPFDRYLPSLPALITEYPTKLETVFLDQFGTGTWQTEKWRVEPARYRAFLCATLRYTIDARETTTNRRESKCFYVKVLRSGGKETYDLLHMLHLRFAAGKAGFTTVKPLAYLDEFGCFVLETASGTPLEQLILEGKALNGAVSKAATALAKFHQSQVASPEYRPVAGTLSRVRKAADFIQWARPNLSKKIEKMIRQIESRLKDVRPCPTHLDIKVDHIFIDGDHVIFIDLDSFALSDPVFDPASFLVRVEMLPNLSPVSRSRVEAISQIFTREYFSRVPKNWQDRLSINYACAAMKVALYFIKHQEPNWRTHVTNIVDRAEEALSVQELRRSDEHPLS